MKALYRLSILLFLITANIAIISLCAQSFYVSTSGLDTNPGTEALPWKTVSKAASTLTAGQTAYVRGGTYYEKVSVANSGTAGNYITITAYPNEKPIIDGTGVVTGSAAIFSIGSRSYIKVSDLRMQNGGMGISCYGKNVIIENNYVYNTSNTGISMANCSNTVVKGNTVERAVYTSWGECINFSQCEYIDVCYNEVKNGSPTNNAGGEGIDVKGSKHVRVFGNIIHDLPMKLGIYLDSYDGLDYDIQVFNNKIYNCTNGILISSEKQNAVEKVWIYNNLIYDITKGYGIGITRYNTDPAHRDYRIKNIIIENNTLTTKGISIDAAIGSDFIIRNNIIYNYTPALAFIGTPSNLLVTNNLASISPILGTSGIVADPQFTNLTTKNFSLQVSSPAIDMGAINNVPFDYNFMKRSIGNAVDLGALEFGSTEMVQLPSVDKPAFSVTTSTVSQSTDDGIQNTSTGAVTLTSTTLSTTFTSTSSKIITALRFSNVAVPKGATIINARIKVKSSAASGNSTDPIQINAESTSNSQTLTADNGSISSKLRTVNAAYWLPGTVVLGGSVSTPSLDFVVGELVSKADWLSGNAMTFLFEYLSGAGKSLQFNAFESGVNAPELNIEYILDNTNEVKTIFQPQNEVKAYPNPTSEYVVLDFQGKTYNTVLVTDVLGKVILTQFIDINSTNLVLDVKSWKKGIHFIQLHDNSSISTCKVIVN